jgi:hypothetical protein
MTGYRVRERIIGRLREEGLGAAARRAWRAAGRKLLRYEVDLYLGVDLRQPSPLVESRLPVDFRWATDEEVRSTVVLMSPNEQANERREARSEDRHWVGVAGDRVAFICSPASARPAPPALATWIGEPQGTACIRGVYTLPEFRGNRLFAAGLCSLFDVLREEGCRYAWAGARHHNLGSIRAQISAGMNVIGIECYWQSLSWRFGSEWK